MFAVAMVTCGSFHPFGYGDTNIPQFSADWQDAWPGGGGGGGGAHSRKLTWTPEVTRKGASPRFHAKLGYHPGLKRTL